MIYKDIVAKITWRIVKFRRPVMENSSVVNILLTRPSEFVDYHFYGFKNDLALGKVKLKSNYNWNRCVWMIDELQSDKYKLFILSSDAYGNNIIIEYNLYDDRSLVRVRMSHSVDPNNYTGKTKEAIEELINLV